MLSGMKAGYGKRRSQQQARNAARKTHMFNPKVVLDPSQVIDHRQAAAGPLRGTARHTDRPSTPWSAAPQRQGSTLDAAALFGGIDQQQPDMQAWLQQLMALLGGGGGRY